MGKEEYERRQKEIAEHAASEGADYFDPDSPVIWKQYIVGPVPRWRRVLWWFFPPSHAKMRGIMRQQSDQMWADATGHLTGGRTPTAGAVVRVFILSMAPAVILSALGPFYFGYTHSPYLRVVDWAFICPLIALWFYRSSLKSALDTTSSVIGGMFLVFAILTAMAAAFLAGDTIFYLIARSLH